MGSTSPHNPIRIAVTADGSLWTAGRELLEGKEPAAGIDPEGLVMRQFDRTGKPLGGHIRRTEIEDSLRFAATRSYLVPAGDFTGWYSYGDSQDGEYIEVSKNGVMRYSLPEFPGEKSRIQTAGVAMMDDGRAFAVLTPGKAHPRPYPVYELDRSAGAWRPVSVPPPLNTGGPIRLYGADGEDLVFQLFHPFRIALFRPH